MALGFLYLGGGRLSLSTSPESIAALICACYPKFPTHSNDNRYHLQAMRHLYVLAAQPRLLLPLESSGSTALRPCYAGVQVVFRDDAGSYQLRAPCLLPELRFLQRVQLLDPRYRSIVFDQQHNWHKLERILAGGDHLVVQRKAGCLSYAEDPTGLASLATPTLSAWAIRTGTVANFSTDPFILFLCRYFLPSAGPASTDSVPLETPLRLLSLVLNDCVVNEKSELIRPWLQLLHQIRIANSSPSSQLPLWQLKFLVRFPVDSTSFIEPEMVLALRHQLESAWDRMSPALRSELQKYLSSGKEAVLSQQRSGQLAQLAVFFDIPLPLAVELATDPVSLLVQLGDQKLAAKLAVLLFL
jgi:anaphase-promoting complex subunit 1